MFKCKKKGSVKLANRDSDWLEIKTVKGSSIMVRKDIIIEFGYYISNDEHLIRTANTSFVATESMCCELKEILLN